MNKIHFLPATFFFSFLSLCVFSQESNNPFKEFGYNVLMATFSKGEYEEFHSENEIVEIGRVLFNTRTQEVVGFVGEENEGGVEPATPAMSIDPLCEKYYWMSPYSYCGNNPVNAIDPDGREIVFLLRNEAGKKVNYTYTSKGLVNQSTGKILIPEKGSHTARMVNAYNKVLNSGDPVLTSQLVSLMVSENVHSIQGRPGDRSSVRVDMKGVGVTEGISMADKGIKVSTLTKFNFTEEEYSRFEKTEGVPNSDFVTVAHELQHQFDFDQGNMEDNTWEGNAQNPAEKRAVTNENRARKIEGLPYRTTYVGEDVY